MCYEFILDDLWFDYLENDITYHITHIACLKNINISNGDIVKYTHCTNTEIKPIYCRIIELSHLRDIDVFRNTYYTDICSDINIKNIGYTFIIKVKKI